MSPQPFLDRYDENYRHGKIRLMQVTHDLAIGGLQRVVVNICRNINRQKFEVSVLCLRGLGPLSDELLEMGIEVTLIPQERGTDYLSFLKVGKIFRRNGVQVIHTHNTQPFLDGTLGGLLSGVRTIVHTEHGRVFPDKRRYMFAEWFASHFAYTVVGVTESCCMNLIKFEKIPLRKLRVIQNGVNAIELSSNFDREKKKRDLGVDGRSFILGVAARLVKEKGLVYLIRAMKRIVREIPGVCLVIAGAGPEEAALRMEAAELGLGTHVLFLGERLDIHEILKTVDVLILPSISEGLPMVLLEALAAGCPIVASNVGGIPTVIKHNVSGFLVEAGNPELLSEETIKMLSSKETRMRFSQLGLKLFRDRFSAQAMTKRYEQLYLRECL